MPMPFGLEAAVVTEVVCVDEACVCCVVDEAADPVALENVGLEFLCFLHEELAVLFAHVYRPGILQLLVLGALQKVFDFLIVVQAFHAIVPELRFGDHWVRFRVQEVLLATLIQRFRVYVHSLEEVLLLLLGERLKDLLDQNDVLVLLLRHFASVARLRTVGVH